MFTIDTLLADTKGWPLVRDLLRTGKLSSQERERIERDHPEFWKTMKERPS